MAMSPGSRDVHARATIDRGAVIASWDDDGVVVVALRWDAGARWAVARRGWRVSWRRRARARERWERRTRAVSHEVRSFVVAVFLNAMRRARAVFGVE